jgi:hypothetical protein
MSDKKEKCKRRKLLVLGSVLMILILWSPLWAHMDFVNVADDGSGSASWVVGRTDTSTGNLGGGGYETKVNGSYTAKFLTGDFNGDGYSDFVNVADNGSGAASWTVGLTDPVTENLADGGYKTKVNGSYTAKFLTGDFNGDGFSDFVNVVDNGSGAASWTVGLTDTLTGNLGGSYKTKVNGPYNATFLTGDFNADGYADFVNVSDNGSGKASWVVGLTDSSTGDLGSSYKTLVEGPNDAQYLTGDFNGDGYSDIVYVSDNGSGDANWVVGFTDPNTGNLGGGYESKVNGKYDAFFLTGDFNGDGCDDFVNVANNGTGDASWVVGLTDPTTGELAGAGYKTIVNGKYNALFLVGDFDRSKLEPDTMSPLDKATEVDLDADLIWDAGTRATSYDVYFGVDLATVIDANHSSSAFMGTVDTNSFSLESLDPDTTYYWRVDDLDDSNDPLWPRHFWSFTTEFDIKSYKYNFVGVTTTQGAHSAYACDVDVFPFGGSQSNRNTMVEATDAQYMAIDVNDTQEWQTSDPGSSDEVFLWIKMKINENVDDITQINFTFNGNTDTSTTEHRIYALKDGTDWWQDSSWVYLSPGQSIPADVDQGMTRSIISNFADYIDASGYITWGVYQYGTSSEALRVNNIEMEVKCYDRSMYEWITQPDVNVSQDTWVDSTNPNTCYGTGGEMDIRPNDVAIAYLQFDLSDWYIPLGHDIERVYLRLQASNSLPTDGEIYVHKADSNSWNELTMTWNNQPGYNSVPAYIASPATSQSIEVTNLFKDSVGGILSLALRCETTGGDSGKCSYYASGSNDPNDHPYLEIITKRADDFGEQWVRDHGFVITSWIVNASKIDDTNELSDFNSMGMNTLMSINSTAINNAKNNSYPWHLQFDQGPAVNWPNWNKNQSSNHVIDTVNSLSEIQDDGGCYVKDEPTSLELEGLGRCTRWIKQNRPNWLVYINVPSGFFGDGNYLDNVMTIVKPDVLVYDVYPFVDDPNSTNYGKTAVSKLTENMMLVRAKAKIHGIPYFGYIQACQIDPYGIDPDFGPYLPSESETRMGIFAHLTAGYKGLYYFTYDSDGGLVEAALTMPDDSVSTVGNYVADISPEIKILGEKILLLDSNDVRFVPGKTNSVTHTNPNQLTAWSSGAGGNALITGVSLASNQEGDYKDGLIGFFDDANYQYFMLTNLYHGPAKDANEAALNFVVTFDSSVDQIWRLNRETGANESIPLQNNTLNLSLPGGTGDLFSFFGNAFE